MKNKKKRKGKGKGRIKRRKVCIVVIFSEDVSVPSIQ